MGPYERIRLCKQIAALRMGPKPKTWKQVSAAVGGIPERTCQDMLAKFNADEGLHDDPLGVVAETLHLYDAGIAIMSDLAVNGDNDNVRAGSAWRMLSAAKGRLELLVAIGKVPSRLGVYAETRDLERVFQDMGTVLQRHGADPELIRDLLRVIGGGDVGEERRALEQTGTIDGDFYEEDEEAPGIEAQAKRGG
jgi:hypothetical protein